MNPDKHMSSFSLKMPEHSPSSVVFSHFHPKLNLPKPHTCLRDLTNPSFHDVFSYGPGSWKLNLRFTQVILTPTNSDTFPALPSLCTQVPCLQRDCEPVRGRSHVLHHFIAPGPIMIPTKCSINVWQPYPVICVQIVCVFALVID